MCYKSWSFGAYEVLAMRGHLPLMPYRSPRQSKEGALPPIPTCHLSPGEAWEHPPHAIARSTGVAGWGHCPPSLRPLTSCVVQGEGAFHPWRSPAVVLHSVLLPRAVTTPVHTRVLRQTNTAQTKTNRQTNKQTTRQTDRQQQTKGETDKQVMRYQWLT